MEYTSHPSAELKTYNRMIKVFRFLTFGFFPASALAGGLAAYMLSLGTPPPDSDRRAKYDWLSAHQEQFLAEISGRFFWTEIHSAILFGGISVFLFVVAMCSLQILVVAKVAKVTAKAMITESKEPKTE